MATGVLTTALSLATLAPMASADPGVPPPTGPHTQAAPNDEGPQRWAPPLAGTSTGVAITEGTARLSTMRDGTETGPAALRGAERQGLLDLGAHQFATPVNRIDAPVTGDVPPGSQVAVDVRGQDADGQWSEWLPAEPGSPAVLPEPTRTVAVRLAMLAPTGSAGPVVRSLEVLADEVPTGPRTIAPRASYRVFATREGLVGGVTANGHRITPNDQFAALPSRRALSPNGRGDYSVRVCAAGGRCATVPVWDVGPWNTKDDYWNPSNQRQQWKDLPQGRPQAQAAFENKHNGGRDGFGRQVKNPAGIDLADGTFYGLGPARQRVRHRRLPLDREVRGAGTGGHRGRRSGRGARDAGRRGARRRSGRRRRPGRGAVPGRGHLRHRHPGHQQPLAAHPAGALRPGRVDPGRAAGAALHLAPRR